MAGQFLSGTWRLRLLISTGISLFLLLFQPLGLDLWSRDGLVIALGFIPLNIIALTAAHALVGRLGLSSPVAPILAIAVIVGANLAYVLPLAGFDPAIGWKVLATALLGMAAVQLWTRSRRDREELIALRRDMAQQGRVIQLLDDNGTDQVQLSSDTLLFVAAEANYVRVVWQDGGQLREKLLRATLKAIEKQAGGVLRQCHRSFLVNLGAADQLELRGSSRLIRFGTIAEVPVSKGFLPAIRAAATA